MWVLGVTWGSLGCTLGSFWGHSSTPLGYFGSLGVHLGALWGHLGSLGCTLGSLGGHLGGIWGHKKQKKTKKPSKTLKNRA